MKVLVLVGLVSVLVFQVAMQEATTAVEAAVAMPPREKTLTLPQKCRHLERERREDEWDEERHEYWPPNEEWEACMGVERR